MRVVWVFKKRQSLLALNGSFVRVLPAQGLLGQTSYKEAFPEPRQAWEHRSVKTMGWIR